MHLLFEHTGKFLQGRILSETDSSAQVELPTGKRQKVKAAHQLLRFDLPEPETLLEQGGELAQEVDLPLAWEFAPESDFGFADLAADYFDDPPSILQQTAALLALHGAPHYFRRIGKGRFRKADAEVLAQALAAIERRQKIEAQIHAWADALIDGHCPPAIREQLYKILFKPDKNTPEYKAVAEATRRANMAPLKLLVQTGAIASAYQFHWQRFLFENFPGGTQFPAVEMPAIDLDLPLADVQAFSIDDEQTTEIDDAFSLQGLGSNCVTLGIHIAAPGLFIQPQDALDELARQRLSTVYMPGNKITMLPQEVVERFTLTAGRYNPVLSLYVSVDADSLEIGACETRIEQISVQANLRHDALEKLFDAEAPTAAENTLAPLPQLQEQLQFLHRLATRLKAGREKIRGKPEKFNRPDYNFKLLDVPADGPHGDEQVEITPRERGAPLDLIISELMILANSHWGQWLKTLGVPAIYRSQASLAPGMRVRTSTRALPHAGMGVASYCWGTSPLRRYVDLVNQWQIIAAARHGNTAALAAPFKPKDTELLAIISAFDGAYSSYRDHQASMERYWCLKHLQQQGIRELTATAIKPQSDSVWLVRADNLPLVLPIMGASSLERGAPLRLRLGQADLVSLDIRGQLLEILDSTSHPAPETDAEDDDEELGATALDIHVEDENADTQEAASVHAG